MFIFMNHLKMDVGLGMTSAWIGLGISFFEINNDTWENRSVWFTNIFSVR